MALNAPLSENIPGLILECDAGLRVLYAGLSASRDFGYSSDEMTGKTLTDFVHPEDAQTLRRVFGKVSRSPGTCSKAAFRFRHKRGSWRYLQGEAGSYADGPGATKTIIHAYDVTREKRKEKRFAESEDLYRTAVGHSVSAMAVVRGGRHVRVSKRFLDLFGFEKPSDVIGKPVSIIAHPDDSHMLVERSIRRERGEPVPSRYTFRGFRRDGEQVVIEVSGTRILYRGKAASLNLLRDVTERRKVEEKLRKSEATMRLVFSASPVGIVLLGENMIVTGINHRINSITGYRPEELIGQDTGMLYATEEERLRVHETVYEDVRQCGMGSMDAKWIRKNGEIRDVYLNAAAIDPGDLSMGMIVTAVDITERKKMDEALRKSEEKYRNIFERSVEGIFQTTLDGKFISANPALARMHGFESSNEFLVHANEKGFRPIVNSEELRKFNGILKENGFIERFEMQAGKKDGSIIWASASARRVEDPVTGTAHHEGTVEDITRRKTAELALRESEKRYKNLFEYANDAIFLIRDHRFMDCNSKSLEMFKCSRDDLIGESIHRFSPPLQSDGEDSREKIAEKVSVAGLGKPQSFEWRHLRADGTPFDAEVSLSNLETRNDRLALFIVRDITDRKRSEQMLSKAMSDLETMNVELKNANIELRESQKKITQQEKMASIGQLAAGVAHEINNPMGFIISNLNSLDKYTKKITEFIRAQDDAIGTCNCAGAARTPLTEARRSLKIDYVLDDSPTLIAESLEGAERVKRIVQDLKSFSRIDGTEYSAVDLNNVMDSTLNIVWNELKYKATVRKDYGPIHAIRCNPGQLGQVFMNLLLNAVQAIPESGEIGIRTWDDGSVVHVAISDTGVGIPEEKLHRIFEPFFTTKEVGAGTGLGLSIVYDIVKKHKGEIEVASEVGKGTVFTINIPDEAAQ